MILLNAKTFRLEEFFGDKVPEYGILSHTWQTEEILFEDIKHLSHEVRTKEGFRKVEGFCKLATEEGLDYVWIDTCCIDKNSSAELSEAINSMFKYYRKAYRCYVYLCDVILGQHDEDPNSRNLAGLDRDLENARWFTRGWTLQELLAPPWVSFYDKSWRYIASKRGLAAELSRITGIHHGVLLGNDHLNYTVAERMSWAAGRNTTRVEDMAYSLLGIFDVNMPLLYGEGDRAFLRLQEEIIKNNFDDTLFSWPGYNEHKTVLATNPLAFKSPSLQYRKFQRVLGTELVSNYSDLLRYPDEFRLLGQPSRLTTKGLFHTSTIARPCEETALVFLHYICEGKFLCLRLHMPYKGYDFFERRSYFGTTTVELIDPQTLIQQKLQFRKLPVYFKARASNDAHWRPSSIPPTFINHGNPRRKFLFSAVDDEKFELNQGTDYVYTPSIPAVFKLGPFYTILGIYKDLAPRVFSTCVSCYTSPEELLSNINDQESTIFGISSGVYTLQLKQCVPDHDHYKQLPAIEAKRRPGGWFTEQNTSEGFLPQSFIWEKEFPGTPGFAESNLREYDTVFYTIQIRSTHSKVFPKQLTRIADWSRLTSKVEQGLLSSKEQSKMAGATVINLQANHKQNMDM
jgi:hypothetical protein